MKKTYSCENEENLVEPFKKKPKDEKEMFRDVKWLIPDGQSGEEETKNVVAGILTNTRVALLQADDSKDTSGLSDK